MSSGLKGRSLFLIEHGEEEIVGAAVVQLYRRVICVAAGVQDAHSIRVDFDARFAQIGESC